MLKRFGVSIDEELLRKFDEYISEKGYVGRSEAIRDLIRNSLIDDSIARGTEEVFGTISVVYDHEVRGISERITHIQHHYVGEIRAAVHVHIDEKNCLEVVIVHGKSPVIREIADKLKSLKGVKNVRYHLTTVQP